MPHQYLWPLRTSHLRRCARPGLLRRISLRHVLLYGMTAGAISRSNGIYCPADRPTSALGSVVLSECPAHVSASDGCVQLYCRVHGRVRLRWWAITASVVSAGPFTAAAQVVHSCCFYMEGGGNASSAYVACPPGSVSASDCAVACTAMTIHWIPSVAVCSAYQSGVTRRADGRAVPR